ncbi:hypothetical protein [Amycolatopsis anabasis]|uniref:hypothetical protein n=1 Tax=Amycolatopsis anabasis TaxID=1840409 RepID=UPI00131EA418|nr:hypothetical protein [Amycolatopsis anabasis]
MSSWPASTLAAEAAAWVTSLRRERGRRHAAADALAWLEQLLPELPPFTARTADRARFRALCAVIGRHDWGPYPVDELAAGIGGPEVELRMVLDQMAADGLTPNPTAIARRTTVLPRRPARSAQHDPGGHAARSWRSRRGPGPVGGALPDPAATGADTSGIGLEPSRLISVDPSPARSWDVVPASRATAACARARAHAAAQVCEELRRRARSRQTETRKLLESSARLLSQARDRTQWRTTPGRGTPD